MQWDFVQPRLHAGSCRPHEALFIDVSPFLLCCVEGIEWFGDPTMKIVPERCFNNLVLQDINLNTGSNSEWQSAESIYTAGNYFDSSTDFIASGGSEIELNSNKIIFRSGTKFENGSHLVAQVNPCTIATQRYYRFNENNIEQPSKTTSESILIDKQEDTRLILYPNPTDGKFNIQILDNKTNSYYLAINNLLGNTIYKEIINSGNYPVDISDMPGGLYVIKVIGQNETYEKIIVVK